MKPKGERYSKIFRRAGLAWGKGDIPKAIAIVEEGLALAVSQGDEDVARVLQQDLERYQRALTGADLDVFHS